MPNLPILLVEDDENDVFLVKYAFQAAGILHPLVVAHDGQEAMDYLSGQGKYADRSQHPMPCLILLDLKLPRVNGMEFLRWLRRESNVPSLAVIVMTSSAHRHDIARAYELGANSFVVKPATVEKRQGLVLAINNYWLLFNELPSETEERGILNKVQV